MIMAALILTSDSYNFVKTCTKECAKEKAAIASPALMS